MMSLGGIWYSPESDQCCPPKKSVKASMRLYRATVVNFYK